MNVLHVNTWATRGGAARAAHRLHLALQEQGHGSRIVSREAAQGRDDLRTWVPSSPLWDRVNRLDRALQARSGLEGLVGIASWMGYKPHAGWADVINLHNLHGYYFSVALLPRLQRAAPLVWTLHDMWPLTGHCAYPGECERWQSGCGLCRDLTEPPIQRDATRLLYKVRRRIYAQIDPVLVAPSRWLLGQSRRAPLTGRFRSVCIPYGLETDTFRPIDTEAARNVLGLSGDEKVILFGAQNLAARRKGADLLLEALGHLRRSALPNVRLMVMGREGTALARRSGYPVLNLGEVPSDLMMATIYSAADVFVLPTRADNLPLVLLESIACGTPCVSFRVGGVPEAVRPGRTGWLAEPEDARDLARCLHEALTDDPLRIRMSAECRRIAQAEYSITLMKDCYVALYGQLMEERQRRRHGRPSPNTVHQQEARGQ